MARKARKTSPDAIYHITSRSISEIPLFKTDDDRDYFLKLLKRYKEYYNCCIYGYCLMTTHYHIHFDGQGVSVSKFMHSLNTAYVCYYNKKYQRHGVLFQGRFFSRILASDAQNLMVSAYIHNNPEDIPQYKGKAEFYPYSSYGIFLGIRKDTLGIVDKSFIYGLIDAKNSTGFAKRYSKFVSKHREINDYDFGPKTLEAEYIYNSGRKVIARDLSPTKVVEIVSKYTIINDEYNETYLLATKYKWIVFRALCAYAFRVLSGFTYNQICSMLNNLSVSGCAALCYKGMELLKNKDYQNLFNRLIDSQEVCAVTLS